MEVIVKAGPRIHQPVTFDAIKSSISGDWNADLLSQIDDFAFRATDVDSDNIGYRHTGECT